MIYIKLNHLLYISQTFKIVMDFFLGCTNSLVVLNYLSMLLAEQAGKPLNMNNILKLEQVYEAVKSM